MGMINKTIQASEGEVAILDTLKLLGDKLTVMHQEIFGQRLVLTKVFSLGYSAAMSSTMAALMAGVPDDVNNVDPEVRLQALKKFEERAKDLILESMKKDDELANEIVEKVLAVGREERASATKP